MVEKTPNQESETGKGLLPQADHPLLVGAVVQPRPQGFSLKKGKSPGDEVGCCRAVVDRNLSNDLLLLIEEIHMKNVS